MPPKTTPDTTNKPKYVTAKDGSVRRFDKLPIDTQEAILEEIEKQKKAKENNNDLKKSISEALKVN